MTTMQYPQQLDRDLRHKLDDFEHEAWMAYRRAKYGPDAPDLCCDPRPIRVAHPLSSLACTPEVATTAA